MLTYERDVHSGILFPTDAQFHMYFYSNELAFLLSIAKENTHRRISIFEVHDATQIKVCIDKLTKIQQLITDCDLPLRWRFVR